MTECVISRFTRTDDVIGGQIEDFFCLLLKQPFNIIYIRIRIRTVFLLCFCNSA